VSPQLTQVPKGHGKTHIGTVYLSGVFNDGGGIEISPTKDGGTVIIHIPPSSPVFQGLNESQVALGERLSSELKSPLASYVTAEAEIV
jgi:hypothetical protein